MCYKQNGKADMNIEYMLDINKAIENVNANRDLQGQSHKIFDFSFNIRESTSSRPLLSLCAFSIFVETCQCTLRCVYLKIF
jgi:hypothetical protein